MVDDRAFDSLVRKHMRAVHAYARAIASDRHAADDAVSETFLRAWKYIDTYAATGSFEGWLLRICRRCVIDQAAHSPDWSSLDDVPVIRLQVNSNEGYSETTQAVLALPLPQREALVLCGVLGYDYQRAADLLGVPIGTIRSRVHRARTTLEQTLRESDEESA